MRIDSILAGFTVCVLLAGCAGLAGRPSSDPLFGTGRSTLMTPPPRMPEGKPIPPGTLMSAWAGIDIGKLLLHSDYIAMRRAVRRAEKAQIGRPIVWRNARSGNSGSVTAVRDGTSALTGTYCREFVHTLTVEGRTEEKYNTVCKRRDGRWETL